MLTFQGSSDSEHVKEPVYILSSRSICARTARYLSSMTPFPQRLSRPPARPMPQCSGYPEPGGQRREYRQGSAKVKKVHEKDPRKEPFPGREWRDPLPGQSAMHSDTHQ